MRISDWSSDVCSSDLEGRTDFPVLRDPYGQQHSVIAESRKTEWGFDITGARFGCELTIEAVRHAGKPCAAQGWHPGNAAFRIPKLRDRKSVVEGKRVSVRVSLGGRPIIYKTTMK